MIVFYLMLVLIGDHGQLRAQPITSNDWIVLVAQLQSKQHRLDTDDRKFLFTMLNVLTSRDDAAPNEAQRKWLLDIERRLKTSKD